MYDPAPRRGPSTPSEWLLTGAFLALLLGLFIGEVFQDYTPGKLSIVLFLAFWVPLLILHEAGHAVVAFLLGWDVGLIVIGMGKCVGHFRLGSTRLEFRLFPVEGFVRCVPRQLRLPRLESALIYLAGPSIELLLAVGILLAVGPERLLDRIDDASLVAWQTLALAAILQGILNLIPMAVRTSEGVVGSDGLGIIQSLVRPESDFARMIGHRFDHDRDWRQREWTD